MDNILIQYKDKPNSRCQPCNGKRFGRFIPINTSSCKSLHHIPDGVIVSHTANDELKVEILQQAQKDRRDGISTYSDSEEEFAQLLNKTQNE